MGVSWTSAEGQGAVCRGRAYLEFCPIIFNIGNFREWQQVQQTLRVSPTVSTISTSTITFALGTHPLPIPLLLIVSKQTLESHDFIEK